MTTTIKVTPELRDRLKAQAARHSRTLGEHLAALAEIEERAARFRRLRQQIAATPRDDLASLRAEFARWESTSVDGLPDEDFSDWPGYAAS